MTGYYCPNCHRYVIAKTYRESLKTDEVCPHCKNVYISDFITKEEHEMRRNQYEAEMQ